MFHHHWFTRPSLLALVLIFSLAHADESQEINARAIMQKVNDREDGQTQFTKQKIATCKYAIKNKRITCTERPRVKLIESIRKDYGANGKDRKTVMLILDPPGERGIGFLQYDYDDQDKETDQWMYLSALGKIKRIISGNDNEPKTGTLFGSEFGYEDTEQVHLDDFTYKIIKEDNYQGQTCWVIESRPTPEHARQSNYSKSVMWIDKQRQLMLKSLLYDRRGKLIKQMTQSHFIQQDGIWVAQKLNMNNVQSRRITTMKLEHSQLNLDVKDNILTQRTLTDGAFREQHLKTLRDGVN